MESFIKAAAVAIIFATPVASIAQSNQALTRAQVRTQLVQFERAGYSPLDWAQYSTNIQAAQNRAFAQDDGGRSETASYGPTVNATSQTGHRVE
jgi:hypothetical protein